MGLLFPLGRVTMADDEWVTGDGILSSATVEIGEDDRSNSCSFTLDDYGGIIAAKYFKVSFDQGGIDVPPELLRAPTRTGTGGGGTATPSDFGGAQGEELARAIIAECHRQGVTDPNQIAYVLATAQLESQMGRYMEEIASGEAYEGRSDLGNSQPGDGVRFKGRGYVQITGRRNYQDWSERLGVDFVSNPELMADPRYALTTLVVGMRDGTFTGRGLDDYIPAGGSPDFYNARRIINGTDKAGQIAEYAQEWLLRIPELSTGNPVPQQPAIADEAQTNPVEVSQRGTEIIVELGFEVEQLEAFHFIHIATNYSRRSQKTTFEGRAVRYVMSRRSRNTSYENITLRELAERVCTRYRVELDMEGDGPTYQYLDQTGISDYQLLLRECRAIGMNIREDGNKLIIRPMRPNFTGILLDESNVIDFRFGDQADADRIIPAPDSVTVNSQPSTDAAQPTATIDRLTGVTVQTNPEDSTGTGADREGEAATTGSPDQPLTGTPAAGGGIPGRSLDEFTPSIPIRELLSSNEEAELRASGLSDEDIEEIYRRRAYEAESAAPATTPTDTESAPAEEVEAVEEITEIPEDFDRELLIKPEELEALQQTPPYSEDPEKIEELYLDRYRRYLLENPPETEDEGASPSAARSESHRVGRGYESSADLITSPEILRLTPGGIIAISNTLVPDVFAREWRVNRVSHSISSSGLKSTLQFYTPVAVRNTSPGGGGGSAGAGLAAAPGGMLNNPMPGALRGTPFDAAGVIRGRAHQGIDLSGGSSDNIYAAASGIATFVGVQGGYGNIIIIEHDDAGGWGGYSTAYAHLSSFLISQGETVAAGQHIGMEGTTGASSGNHLHFELRQGSQKIDPEPYLAPPPPGVYGQGSGYPIRTR